MDLGGVDHASAPGGSLRGASMFPDEGQVSFQPTQKSVSVYVPEPFDRRDL